MGLYATSALVGMSYCPGTFGPALRLFGHRHAPARFEPGGPNTQARRRQRLRHGHCSPVFDALSNIALIRSPANISRVQLRTQRAVLQSRLRGRRQTGSRGTRNVELRNPSLPYRAMAPASLRRSALTVRRVSSASWRENGGRGLLVNTYSNGARPRIAAQREEVTARARRAIIKTVPFMATACSMNCRAVAKPGRYLKRLEIRPQVRHRRGDYPLPGPLTLAPASPTAFGQSPSGSEPGFVLQ